MRDSGNEVALRWTNTVFGRALADAIQCVQGLQKQTWCWYSNHFICSMSALSLLFIFEIESSVLVVLVLITKVC